MSAFPVNLHLPLNFFFLSCLPSYISPYFSTVFMPFLSFPFHTYYYYFTPQSSKHNFPSFPPFVSSVSVFFSGRFSFPLHVLILSCVSHTSFIHLSPAHYPPITRPSLTHHPNTSFSPTFSPTTTTHHLLIHSLPRCIFSPPVMGPWGSLKS